MTVLVGGGRDAALVREVLRPFVAALDGGEAACVIADEGDGVDLERWTGVLADCSGVRPVVVSEGRPLTPADIADCAGVFVAGGLTPLYATLVVPAREAMADLPYAGLSAGAAIASARAIVGGWRVGELQVCSEDAGEDLDELAVVDGLGRVPYAVDVHAAQWGTVTRALQAVRLGRVEEAWAIDEHTALVLDGAEQRVLGTGAAHHLTRSGDGVLVRSTTAG